MHWFKKSLSEDDMFLAGDHTRLQEILKPARDGYAESFSLAYAELEPGKSSLPHRLEGSAEVYIVLSGAGEVHIDEDIFRVEAGDTVYIPAGAEQYVKSVGKESLCFYCLVSPPWAAENEKIGPAAQ